MVKLLHNGSCSKSRLVFSYLTDNGVDFELIDIVKTPLSVLELKTVLKKLNISAIELTRIEEKAWQENYAGKNLSEEQIVSVLAEHPELIQRPIIIQGTEGIIGRPLQKVIDFVSK